MRAAGLLPTPQLADGMLQNTSKPQTKSYHTNICQETGTKNHHKPVLTAQQTPSPLPLRHSVRTLMKAHSRWVDTVLGQDAVGLLMGWGTESFTKCQDAWPNKTLCLFLFFLNEGKSAWAIFLANPHFLGLYFLREIIHNISWLTSKPSNESPIGWSIDVDELQFSIFKN